MARPITFSRTFPDYHPKAGQPTYFVEKFIHSIGGTPFSLPEIKELTNKTYRENNWPKHHTIRARGKRPWKVGDKFSPRVWGNDVNPKSGRTGPYQSKQIIISPDVEIKKIWSFEITSGGSIILGGKRIVSEGGYNYAMSIPKVAANDALQVEDFLAWFKYPKPFSGQIICWNENINY